MSGIYNITNASYYRKVSWNGENGHFFLFDKIEKPEDRWTSIPHERIFMELPYLRAMENSGLLEVKPYYGLLLDQEGNNVAAVFLQLKMFRAEQALKWESPENMSRLKLLRNKLKRKLAASLKFATLVLGNLSMSGPYGQYVSQAYASQMHILLPTMAEWAYQLLKSDHKELKAILLKDYYEPLSIPASFGFAEFEIQPSMELQLNGSWGTFDDYLNALRSKYRVRYHKARERRGQIAVLKRKGSEMSDNQLSQLHDLYLLRADHASFNIATLHPRYFHEISKELPDSAHYLLYYKGEDLIGFMCMIHDGNTLDAQFTGYNDELNPEHDLYLNLLYDVIAKGIELEVNRICFARTALEIKSSVGAGPQHLYCYMWYDSAITNIFIPSIINYLEPRKEWHQRRPFRPEEADGSNPAL